MIEKADKSPPVASDYPVLSEIGSAHAPLLYFEAVSAYGYNDNVVRISLEASRMVSGAPGSNVAIDRVIVAHLRMTVQGALSLKHALDAALLMAAPAESEAKN